MAAGRWFLGYQGCVGLTTFVVAIWSGSVLVGLLAGAGATFAATCAVTWSRERHAEVSA